MIAWVVFESTAHSLPCKYRYQLSYVAKNKQLEKSWSSGSSDPSLKVIIKIDFL